MKEKKGFVGEPGAVAFLNAKALIADGFFQVSHRYRTVARVPPGKTAIEALEEVDPRAAAQIRERIERDAADHYMRCYAKEPHKVDLNAETFAAFRLLGGGPR